MKGVSAVIATILMLMITIALAGMAYMYISGVFTARTAVALSMTDTICETAGVRVYVRNDGTAASGDISVTVGAGGAGNTCTIGSLSSGAEGNCATTVRPAPGYTQVRAVATGASTRGSVYCT